MRAPPVEVQVQLLEACRRTGHQFKEPDHQRVSELVMKRDEINAEIEGLLSAKPLTFAAALDSELIELIK